MEGGVGKALGKTGAVPANKDNEHHGVGGDEAGGGKVDEPEEDGHGVLGTNEEGDAADEGDGGDAVDGHTSLGALHEYSGSLAI